MMQVFAGLSRKFLHSARVAVDTVVSPAANIVASAVANNDAPVIIAAVFGAVLIFSLSPQSHRATEKTF